jgi:transcriptional regulator GlxA family with amidase domain
MKTTAFRCGFASDEQMRKVFKKRLSITAREYRARHCRPSTGAGEARHRQRDLN